VKRRVHDARRFVHPDLYFQPLQGRSGKVGSWTSFVGIQNCFNDRVEMKIRFSSEFQNQNLQMRNVVLHQLSDDFQVQLTDIADHHVQ
jgi:hypothetical protein